MEKTRSKITTATGGGELSRRTSSARNSSTPASKNVLFTKELLSIHLCWRRSSNNLLWRLSHIISHLFSLWFVKDKLQQTRWLLGADYRVDNWQLRQDDKTGARCCCCCLLQSLVHNRRKITAGEWKSDRKVKRKETLFFFSFCRLLLLVTEWWQLFDVVRHRG